MQVVTPAFNFIFMGENSSMGSSVANGLFQLANTGLQMLGSYRQQKRNIRATQQLAQQNFQYQQQLQDQAHKWSVEDAKNLDAYKMESLAKAGLNPALAYNGSNSLPIASASMPSTPYVHETSPLEGLADLPSKLLNNELLSAQIQNIISDTRKKNSEAETNEINNTFLGNVNDLKIKLTQDEYNNAIYLQGYYADNPDLLNAIADEKNLQNQNLIANYDNLARNLSYLDSQIEKNNSERAYLARKTLSLDVQDSLTRENIIYLHDSNVRYNYQSAGWLINEMSRVQQSEIPADVKTQRLAMLSNMYDQATGRTTLMLQHQNNLIEQQQHDSNVSSNVDKYINQQDKDLQQRKIEFAWNKVFQAVDMTIGTVVPYYSRQQQYEHDEKMQESRFQHDSDMEDVRYQHSRNIQFDNHRHDEKMQDSRFHHDNFMDEKQKYYDEHHPQYDDYWYDNEGNYHHKKYRK